MGSERVWRICRQGVGGRGTRDRRCPRGTPRSPSPGTGKYHHIRSITSVMLLFVCTELGSTQLSAHYPVQCVSLAPFPQTTKVALAYRPEAGDAEAMGAVAERREGRRGLCQGAEGALPFPLRLRRPATGLRHLLLLGHVPGGPAQLLPEHKGIVVGFVRQRSGWLLGLDSDVDCHHLLKSQRNTC